MLPNPVESLEVHIFHEIGRLLGFIVSKEGIRVDPLKVEEIFGCFLHA